MRMGLWSVGIMIRHWHSQWHTGRSYKWFENHRSGSLFVFAFPARGGQDDTGSGDGVEGCS